MLSFLIATFSVFLSAELVSAQVIPLSPGPNETYIAGKKCHLSWQPDKSGSWKNMTIDLKSGSNLNMTPVRPVAINIDGTNDSLTPFTWPCPEVNPYSAIYFYQFTNNLNLSEVAWTTRFTIASKSGHSSPPEHALQPNGDPIPWGFGHPASDLDNNATASEQSDSFAVTLGTPPHNGQHVSQAIFSAHRGYQSARLFAGGHASQTAFTSVSTNAGELISAPTQGMSLQDPRMEIGHASQKCSINRVLFVVVACIALYHVFY